MVNPWTKKAAQVIPERLVSLASAPYFFPARTVPSRVKTFTPGLFFGWSRFRTCGALMSRLRTGSAAFATGSGALAAFLSSVDGVSFIIGIDCVFPQKSTQRIKTRPAPRSMLCPARPSAARPAGIAAIAAPPPRTAAPAILPTFFL